VESITINGGDATRSEVSSLSVVFDSRIQFPASTAFVLTNKTSGQVVTGVSVNSAHVAGKTVSVLSFSGGPSVIARSVGGNTLADGVYELSILSGGIVAQTGLASMDQNEVFGDQPADEFFRKYGDNDGDGVVGLFDFAAFRRSFGLASGDVNFRGGLDGDGDGIISLLDFAAFRKSFGK
jgi:hypothetical protein